MLALGHSEHADSIGVDHPETLAALAAARTFREDSKAFVNLTLYEQRLKRAQKEALRQLQDLQSKRIAARQAALDEAVAIRNLHKMKAQPYDPAVTPASNQFVFSTAEIELEARRQSLHADAQNARSHHYNLADYNQSPLKRAA
jgi:transposase